jgi:molecular chaperone IbpA
LELALAGFKQDEINVYTEYGKLVVKGEKNHKEEEATYVVQGLAQRNFERAWTLSDDTEVRSVAFENGLLTVELHKVVPEKHTRKDWF